MHLTLTRTHGAALRSGVYRRTGPRVKIVAGRRVVFVQVAALAVRARAPELARGWRPARDIGAQVRAWDAGRVVREVPPRSPDSHRVRACHSEQLPRARQINSHIGRMLSPMTLTY